MGYRRLLKSYLKHIDSLLGSTLIDTLSTSSDFSKRDLGELNAIAAEIARESFAARERAERDERNKRETAGENEKAGESEKAGEKDEPDP